MMMTRVKFSLVAVLFGALFALSGCPSPKPKYPTCSSEKDCKSGEFCVNKQCVQCKTNANCKQGEQCQNNQCEAIPGWCADDSDCSPEQTCKNNKCSTCSADSECGEGGRCQEGKCLRKGMCNTDDDCAETEYCEAGRCRPGKTSGPVVTGCSLGTIYFEYDAATLSEDAKSTLAANAECIKTQGKAVALVGHTDPRGTEEYNLALSERRARAVRDYLKTTASGAKTRVVPKGELDSSGTEESSWSQDRRVEFQWE